MREKVEEAEAAARSIQSQPWHQIRQDTKQDKDQPPQSAYELADHYETTSIQQEGISGIPVIHRLKSSTHLNNINSLKNSNMQAQGPQGILSSISQAHIGQQKKHKPGMVQGIHIA